MTADEPMSTPDSGGLREAVARYADRHPEASLRADLRAILAAHPEPVPTEEVHLSTDESEPVPTHDSEAGRLRQQRDAMQALAERNAEDAALWRAQFNRQHGASSGLWVNPDGTTQPVISSTLSAGPTFDDLLADPTQQLDEEGVVAASIPTPDSADDAMVGEREHVIESRGRVYDTCRCGWYGSLGDDHIATATPPADDVNRAPVSGGLDEGEREALDDGPECDNCGKTTCPDADLPEFSEPRECEFASLYEAFRASKDCDYGCGRDYSMQAVRLWLAPEMKRILATRDAAWVERVAAERDTARREAGEAGAKAVRDAADEVHRESRWSLEQAMQGKPQDAVDRLLVLERVLRARADALTSDDGSGA